MEPTNIDEIIKECLKEWKGSAIKDSDSEEETTKDKGKGKEKAREKENKERVGEKCKATQEDQPQPKKMKTKSHRPISDVHLGLDDYELIATRVLETLDAPMTTIVTTQTAMKSALDVQIAELKTIVERASQLTSQTPSTSGSWRGDSTAREHTHVIQIFPPTLDFQLVLRWST